MAVTEEAVVTALPAGLARPEVAEAATGDPGARLAVVTAFVSPRVDAGGDDVRVPDLARFGRWPDTIEAWRPAVVVDGAPVDAVRHPLRPAPDADLWSRLFEAVGVRARTFRDLAKQPMLDYPASAVDRLVGRVYAAHSGTELPMESQLVSLYRAMGESRELLDLPADALADRLDSIYRRIDALGAGPQADWQRLGLAGRYFHRPEAARPTPPGTSVADHLKSLEAPRPEYDLHEVCAALGDYPLLLRALGLAVDLLVDEGVLADGGWIAITDPPGDLADLGGPATRPRTRYRHEDGLFVARERDASPDPGIRSGMLDLRRHGLTTLDVDGAAPQVIQALASTAHRVQVMAAAGEHHRDPAALPALRTGGVTVYREQRRGVLAGSLARSAAHEADVAAGAVPELWADDVARGWRIDVLDRGSSAVEWRSLMARRGVYEFAGQPLDLPGEEFEAHLKSASASTDTAKPLILYTTEVVAGWDGWSLAARRPGRVITPAGVEDHDATPLAGFPLSVSFAAAGASLPLLRFGRAYHLRARVADLAGNGHDLASAPDGFESDAVVMTRWEPVPPPEVVPARPFGEGESLLRVVLRSTRDVAVEDYVALPRVQALGGHPAAGGGGADWRYQAVAARHLLAPKESQLQAERHGGFDAAFGAGDPTALWPLLGREEATFYDLPGVVLVDQSDPSAAVTPPATRGGELGPHRYVTLPAQPAAAPYLPDHLAHGVAIHDLPGRPPDAPLRVALATPANRWPDHRAASLEVVEGPLGASVDATTGVVTVSLPKAEMVDVRLSSLPGSTHLPMLAVWERVVRAYASGELTSPALGDVETAARTGRVWSLTPWITMTLVHAVEKPLAEPKLVLPGNLAHRFAGETNACLVGSVGVHAKSTGRVDVDATWTEPRDAPGTPPTLDPGDWIGGAGHVGDFDVARTEDTALTGRDPVSGHHVMRHEFGDTKHRMVRYRTTATTRYRDYFPPEITGAPALVTTTSDVTVDVPSSRQPEPPEVVGILPVFGWDEGRYGRRTKAGRTWPPAFRRTRRGGGLRIHLRRPWWSSGEGEMLAVVLPNQPAPSRILEPGGLRRIAGALKAALDEAGTAGVTTPRLNRALRLALEQEAGTARAVVPVVRRSLLEMGVVPAAGVLERVWGEVIGTWLDPIIAFPPSPLDEHERSAFVTRWGLDPTVVAGLPGLSPRIADFLDRDGHATDLQLPAGERVAVALYQPEFDPVRDQWYVDLHLAEHDHVLPFVRLALARYQQHSVRDQELSDVRVGDFAQLLPTRELTVRDFGDAFAHVTLRGRSGYGEVGVSLGRDRHSDVANSTLVRAWVEQHPRTSATDLDWQPATDDDTWLPLDQLDGWEARWFAKVPLPAPKASLAYRLVVEEFQVHRTDPLVPARDPGRFGYLGDDPVGLRLLWTDHVALTEVGGRLGPDAPDR